MRSKTKLLEAIAIYSNIFDGDEKPEDDIILKVKNMIQIKEMLEHAKDIIEDLESRQCKCGGSCGCQV